jgi:glycerophosphoryl diester phosphodiesterase
MMTLLFILVSLSPSKAKPFLVAHRGAHHSYRTVAPPLACRTLIGPQRHRFIENTIPSIAHAFERGADIVEVDVVATRDLQVVLSHELALDCYTDGTGPISQQTLVQLRQLDLGYGYTFDGKTFPFRGKGLGAMTTLSEVARRFPGKKILLNPKVDDPHLLLSAFRKRLGGIVTENFYFWGDEEIYRALAKNFRLNSYISIPSRSRECIAVAMSFSWFGFFPETCAGKTLSLTPGQLAGLGGWQGSFVRSLRQSQGQVWLYVPNHAGSLRLSNHHEAQAVIVSNIDEWISHE